METPQVDDRVAAEAAGGKDPGPRPLTLYLVRLSPPCRAVWLYLLQHKIRHELVDVDFSSGENVPELVQRCSHHEVPVLVDGDIVVFEGPAILRYLAMQYTNLSGFGPDLQTRMTVESLISWANAELHRVVGPFYAYPACLEHYRLADDRATEALTDKGISHLSKHLEHLESRYLARHAYLTGPAPTVADTFVATVLLQAEWVGFSFRMWPRVAGWIRRLQGQEHWAKVHVDHRHVLAGLEHVHL